MSTLNRTSNVEASKMMKSDLRSTDICGGDVVDECDGPAGRIMLGTDDLFGLGRAALVGLGASYHSSAMAATVIVSVEW